MTIAPGTWEYQLNIFLISPLKPMLWVLITSDSANASNEYPQHRFSWRNKKKYHYFMAEKSALSGVIEYCSILTFAMLNK